MLAPQAAFRHGTEKAQLKKPRKLLGFERAAGNERVPRRTADIWLPRWRVAV